MDSRSRMSSVQHQGRKPLASSSKQRKAILLDIDHTVSNAFWRDQMVAAGDWDAYHSAAVNDQPILDIVEMLRRLHAHYLIIGFTSRPEKWRKMTVEWLLKHNVPFDEIHMRPADDNRKSPELKVSLAMGRFGRSLSETVAFVMDDRDDVIAAFRAIGVTAIQIYAKKEQPR